MSEEQKETKLEQARREMQEREGTTPVNKETKIVHNMAELISRNTQEPTETPADLIEDAMRHTPKIGHGNQKVVAAGGKKGDVELPKLNPLPPLVIDGHEFARTNIPYVDAITIVMYILAEVLSDDPRIDSILRQVQFAFPDAAGNVIFPKAKPKPENETR